MIDLVSEYIEKRIPHCKSGSPIQPPGTSESPTIKSILADSQRNWHNVVAVPSSTQSSTPPSRIYPADLKVPQPVINLEQQSSVAVRIAVSKVKNIKILLSMPFFWSNLFKKSNLLFHS